MADNEGKFMWLGNLRNSLIVTIGALLITAAAQMLVTVPAITALQGLPQAAGLYGSGRYLMAELRYLLSQRPGSEEGERRRLDAEISTAVAAVDERYRRLLRGDPQAGIPPADDPRVLRALQDSAREWDETKRLIESQIHAPPERTVPGVLERIEQALVEQMAQTADAAGTYRSVSDERVNSAQQLQFIFLGLYVLVALAVILVARKALKTVQEAVASLGSGTSEILAGASQQASGATEQSAAVNQTLTTIEELLQSAHQVAERAKSVAGSADRASQVGQDGRDALEASIESMHAVKDQTELLANNIQNLAQETQSIGEIILSVADIAEQTNLLAINAGIEASRAGASGPGFAFVAREIKELADQAKQSTAQVRQILGKIQNATNSAVMVMEEGTKRVNVTIDEVNLAGEPIRKLVESISEHAVAAAQISAATSQQVTGISQIQQAMSDVDQATSQNVAASRQAEEVAQSLDVLGMRLRKMLTG